MSTDNANIKFSLTGGLSEAVLERIYSEALRVLEKLGIECDVPRVLAKLSGVDGISIKGKRIHYAPATVEAFLDRKFPNRKTKAAPAAPGPLTLMGPYSCLNMVDMETRVVRKPAVSDIGPAVRLLERAGDRTLRG